MKINTNPERAQVKVSLYSESGTSWCVLVERTNNGNNRVWFPKSVCALEKSGNEYTLSAPIWLFKKNNVKYETTI